MDWPFGWSEATWRLVVFAAIFLTMAGWELAAPRRQLSYGRGRRWPTNWGIVLLNTALVRVLFPAAAVGVAVFAETRGWGLLPMLGWPRWIDGIVGFLVLDFAVWLMHVIAHKWPLLWRVHKMHHADPDIDVSTAIRFHPVEIVVSMAWKSAFVIALGIPPEAVLIFEMVLSGGAMFNHSNVRLPLGLDRLIRPLVVTPDMHRVHHSVHRRETDSNYGFNLAVWDRLFGTYIAQPQDGHEGMTIGLSEYQSAEPTGILWCLGLPFRGGLTGLFSRRDSESDERDGGSSAGNG